MLGYNSLACTNSMCMLRPGWQGCRLKVKGSFWFHSTSLCCSHLSQMFAAGFKHQHLSNLFLLIIPAVPRGGETQTNFPEEFTIYSKNQLITETLYSFLFRMSWVPLRPQQRWKEWVYMCLHSVPKQFLYGLDDPRNKRSYWFRGEGGSVSVFSRPLFFSRWTGLDRLPQKTPQKFFFSFLIFLLSSLFIVGEELWTAYKQF